MRSAPAIMLPPVVTPFAFRASTHTALLVSSSTSSSSSSSSSRECSTSSSSTSPSRTLSDGLPASCKVTRRRSAASMSAATPLAAGAPSSTIVRTESPTE